MTVRQELPRTAVRRLGDKQVHGRPALDAVLDAGRVAHVGLMDDGLPYVLPCGYARDGDRVLLHGSTASRLFRSMGAGSAVCVTVTLLDGLVLARSAFESSMHYRSAMVLGVGSLVDGPDKLPALEVLAERLLPGRWQHIRPPSTKELAATAVVAVPLLEWSVKVSDSPPEDLPEDLLLPVWAGVVPLRETAGPPVAAPDLDPAVPLPEHVRRLTRR